MCGEPPPEPEGLTEEEYAAYYETSHNCDAMGCGTLKHVVYRFAKQDGAPLPAQPAHPEDLPEHGFDGYLVKYQHTATGEETTRFIKHGSDVPMFDDWTVAKIPQSIEQG